MGRAGLIQRVHGGAIPVIDAHNHLGETFGGGWDSRPLAELLDVLDAAKVRAHVDLDGGWGEDLFERHLDHFKAKAPDRFQIFGGVDWAAWAEQGNRCVECMRLLVVGVIESKKLQIRYCTLILYRSDA